MITADYIKALLEVNPKAVERAMVVLYQRQTADEQASESTRHSNGQGFSAFDARLGSYYAKWVLSGRSLTGQHLHKARQLANKYARQLVESAQAKAAELSHVESHHAAQ